MRFPFFSIAIIAIMAAVVADLTEVVEEHLRSAAVGVGEVVDELLGLLMAYLLTLLVALTGYGDFLRRVPCGEVEDGGSRPRRDEVDDVEPLQFFYLLEEVAVVDFELVGDALGGDGGGGVAYPA